MTTRGDMRGFAATAALAALLVLALAGGAAAGHRGYSYKMPPTSSAMEMKNETIASVASTKDKLSTFVAAVSASPDILAAASDPDSEVTVLAPTNAAFVAALEELGLELEALVNDTELLTKVLSYHILTSVIPAADVPGPPGADVPTLLGPTVFAEKDNGTVTFNEVATVVKADVMGGKSIIHVIDSVLVPPDLL